MAMFTIGAREILNKMCRRRTGSMFGILRKAAKAFPIMDGFLFKLLSRRPTRYNSLHREIMDYLAALYRPAGSFHSIRNKLIHKARIAGLLLAILLVSDSHASCDPKFDAKLKANPEPFYKKLVSPDGQYECWKDMPEAGSGTVLFFRNRGLKSEPRVLWGNARWMYIEWSPDSRYVGIDDFQSHDFSHIVIFRVKPDLADPVLVYELPAKDRDNTNWVIDDWIPEKGQVIFLNMKNMRGKYARIYRTVTLGDKKIEQDNYKIDPRLYRWK
jgi:hypothetical protein